ncbi:MAG: histidine kinase dimerization/phospho-acceptor domain-containing protein [Pseudomonadota bacterium]
MISLDPTSMVVFAAGSVAIAIVLCFALRRHRRGDRAIRWLISSNLLLFSAALGVLLTPALGFVTGALVVIVGAYGGICCAYFAVLSAEGHPLPWRSYGLIGLVGTAAQAAIALLWQDAYPLMLSSSCLNSAVTGVMVVTLWRRLEKYGPRMATLLCLPFAALCVGYAGRLLAIALFGDSGVAVTVSATIIVAMAWAAIMLELGLAALRERQLNLQLKEALDLAHRAEAARSRFLLGISHELRTPLNGITGLASLLKSEAMGPLPPAYASHGAEISQQAADLLCLIERLLDHTEGDEMATEDSTQALLEAIRWKFDEVEEARATQDLPPGEDASKPAA